MCARGFSPLTNDLKLRYLASKVNQLLVIEAKYEDLTRGFTQLVAELVALDQWEGAPTVSEQPFLVGAITTGTIWQFCRLDRTVKHFEQGINSYRVTEDIEQVMRILVAALNHPAVSSSARNKYIQVTNPRSKEHNVLKEFDLIVR